MNENIITLFGTISSYWYGKNYIKYFLDKYHGKPVRLKVCSYGGEVGEALAISALLAEHGNVTVEYVGLNASAATWMAFGAKRIEMRDDAMWLCHKSMLNVDIYGNLNADKIEEKIKELETAKKNTEAIDLLIAKKYADRCGKKIVEVLDLMKLEQWMPADKVLEWGFVDAVLPSQEKRKGISDDVKNCLEAMGLPLPADEVLENKAEDSNLVSQIIEGVKNIFSNKTQEKPKKQTIMNEKYTFINGVLKVQGVNETDGQVTLTAEQMKTINEALEAAENAKKLAQDAKDKAENSMTELINDLDALGDGIKNVEGNKEKVAAIKTILDKLPATDTEQHKQGAEENKFAAVALDPINNYGMD